MGLIAILSLLANKAPITPVTKLESPTNTQRPRNIEEGGSRSVSQPETPDSISTAEQDDQHNNDFEMYNRVQISPKAEPNNVPEEEEDEGIDGR